MSDTSLFQPPQASRLTPYALLPILLLATFLRLYQLPTLPPGLNFDEAGSGVAALDILTGTPRLWWQIGGGQEPLWPYMIALSTLILGNVPLALRLPAALAGILTVAAVYPLTVRLFRQERQENSIQASLIGLLTMLGLALSEWHLHFSRLGFRAILLPLLSTLAFYFLWRVLSKNQGLAKFEEPARPRAALRLRSTRAWHPPQKLGLLSLSACLLALTIYTYLAARLLPLVPLLFFITHWLLTRRSSASANYLRLLLYYLLFTGLFLLPLIIYFSLNPADFIARAGMVSVFNPAWNNGDPLGTFWRTFILTLSTFIGLSGDPNPLVNLPYQPALPLVLAPFFFLGLATSLYKTLQPLFNHKSLISNYQLPITNHPHHFLLLWWLIMLLPAILAPEGAPHHLRLLGTLVPTYIFVALGFTSALNLLNKFLRSIIGTTQHATRLSYLLPATCYLLLAFQTSTNYFSRWPNSVDFTLPFDLYAVRLAADISHTPPEAGYVIPMDIRAGAEARHYTLDYILGSSFSSLTKPQSLISNLQLPREATNYPAYTYLPVDKHQAETLLSQAAKGKNELRVVRWTEDKHREADTKEIVTYLLETNTQFLGRESFRVYDLETYKLASQPTFTLPPINQSLGLDFEGLLRLDAAFVPSENKAGGWLPVALTFAPLAPMAADYKASLRLIGPSGERIAQKDRTLRHNFHQGTSLWPPETVNEYYLLPLPPETPSGNYTVTLVIYHPDTLAPLISEGVDEVPVGSVHLNYTEQQQKITKIKIEKGEKEQ